jgi:serine palmitoyltransferase
LERIIRDSIAYGQPRTRRPWKKVIIIVEGVYSMEGEICKLKEIVEIKKKYKCYLYVDEAHSIGALGPHGKGVCDFTGVNPADVDILMGTFTKSFGSVGGYISGSKKFIDYLRRKSWSTYYAATMAPACAQQILSALKVIDGKDGTTIGEVY